MTHERRVFVALARPPAAGDVLALENKDVHHLATVLRLESGAAITVVEKNTGREYLASFIPDSGECQVSSENSQLSSSPDAGIIVALLKGGNSEFACEKATELGARRIKFFQADRSVVKLKSEDDRIQKQLRLSRVVESAAKQSGQRVLPIVEVYRSLQELVRSLPSDRSATRLVCSLGQDAKGLKTLQPLGEQFDIAIGPEGDFSSTEYSLLLQSGFQPTTLGPWRLKSETAVIVALSRFLAFNELGL